jgi:hypothetical protein
MKRFKEFFEIPGESEKMMFFAGWKKRKKREGGCLPSVVGVIHPS